MPPKAPGKAPAGKKSAPLTGVAKMKAEIAAKKAEEERFQKEQEEEEKREREERRLAEQQRRIDEQEQKKKEEEERAEAEKRRKADADANKKKHAQNKLEELRRAGLVNENYEEHMNVKEEKATKKPKAKLETKQEEEEEDDWEAEVDKMEKKDAAEAKKKEQHVNGEKSRKEDSNVGQLRSPICCVMGHVDAGKTSLLDRIRVTNVAGGEAGGITQQIGATFFPRENLQKSTACVKNNEHLSCEIQLPGLLVIDTPGHESFNNLRSRGSSLCDIAIVVIDIHSGLEKTTRESLRMLAEKKIPFVVALNKVDRIYKWKKIPDVDFETEYNQQDIDRRVEFDTLFGAVNDQYEDYRTNMCLTPEDHERGASPQTIPAIELYWRNPTPKNIVSVVPTSAFSGEGVSDLLLLMVKLVQGFMDTKVRLKDDLTCTILEVKQLEGQGMTMDVVVVNGVLYIGDEIVVSGVNGPFRTKIKYLLTPQPMKELRVKGEYARHDKIQAAMVAKVVAEGLENAIAGTSVRVITPNGPGFDELAKQVQSEVSALVSEAHAKEGVIVHSSTVGALEALLTFLNDNKIPVAATNVGPVHKRHVQAAAAIHDKNPRFGVIMAFDVDLKEDVEKYADMMKVTVFRSGIIYELTDKFLAYYKEASKTEMDKIRDQAVFPVLLKIEEKIKERPLVLKVFVFRGDLHKGTPMCVVSSGTVMPLGRVARIRETSERNKEVDVGKRLTSFTVELTDSKYTFGRHFTEEYDLISELTRPSVEAVKVFKDELDQDATNLLRDLVKLQGVPPPVKTVQQPAPGGS